MRKTTRRHRSNGGDVSAVGLSEGKASGVRARYLNDTPAQRLSVGRDQGKRSGMNSKSLAIGIPGGRRAYATGGHAIDAEFEEKGERFRKIKKRNEILGSPHYSKGGKIPLKMKFVFKKLHGSFENEPQMKKIGAKKESVYEGEPHRFKRSSSGRLLKS